MGIRTSVVRLISFITISLSSCKDEQPQQGVICTDEFRSTTIYVPGAPLTESFTIRLSNSDTIRMTTNADLRQGYYLVLDDHYQPKLENQQDNFRFIGKQAGEALKGVKGWKENGNGTNSSGFDALAGGLRKPDGSYLNQGSLAFFWTSSRTNSVDKAWEWNFHYGGPPNSNKQNLKKAFRFDADVSGGLSVRLVRD